MKLKEKVKNSKFSKTKLFKSLLNNKYCLLAAGCTFLLILAVYCAYELIPLGNKTVLRMDLYHQYGPLFTELYERVKNSDSLLYSWTSGGGGAFLGNFFNYLSSPFGIIMFIFGHKNMPEAIATMILLKACTASFTFSYFLSKKAEKVSAVTSAFGVLYACSGYFIAYYWNIMWLDAFYLFPLVMLGLEKLISQRKMKLYIVSLALTFVTNYYMAYMVCIFSVLYFIYYYFSVFAISETYLGKLKKPEKGIFARLSYVYDCGRNSKFIDSGVRFALSSVAAAALAAFALIPVYFVLKNCSATSGTFPKDFKTYFSIFDFLANHLAYLNPTIRSSGADVLPNVYCGILTVMLVPLFIFSDKIKLQEKIFSIGILGVMFASCYTNWLNYIWHGFHFPNDLPYRFSYMYSFLLLIFAYKAIGLIKEYSKKQIIGVGTATVFFVIIVQEIGSKNFTETGVWISIAFIGIYCLALGILKNDRYPKAAAAVLILCSCCAEYLVANTNNYSMDQLKTNFVGDYDDFVKVKSDIDENEKDGVYRMELTSLRARMDPCWYYYNGISTFSSMAYEKVSNMQYHLGMFGNYINSYTYNRQTAVYNAFFALDYIVDNSQKNTTQLNPKYYTDLSSSGVFTAYKNEYSLPIAFRANSDIEYWSHDTTNPFTVQSNLFESATGLSDVFKDIKVERITTNNVTSSNEDFGDSGCYPFEVTGSLSDASLTYTLTVEKSGNAYLYYKTGASNVDNITVTLPGEVAISQSIDSKPFILDLGYLNEGDEISVYAPIKEGNVGYTYIYAVTLDDDVFKEGYNKLKANSLSTEVFDETHIKGTINADSDGIIFTSINYDNGWSVYLDGEKVSKDDIVKIGDALLGIRVTAGTHTLELNFMPEGLVAGTVISLVTLVILLIVMLLIKKNAFSFDPELYVEEETKEDEAAASSGALKEEPDKEIGSFSSGLKLDSSSISELCSGVLEDTETEN